MANSEHVQLFGQGVKRWNEWRAQNPEVVPDLSGLALWDLKKTGLKEPYLAEINLQGANLEGIDLQVYKHWYPCLDRANLRKAYLTGANLHGVSFREADLAEASLANALLFWADLSGANLERAVLHNADLTFTKLVGASLSSASLVHTHFHEAELDGVDLTNAFLQEADLAKVDLRSVKGLESIEHAGPSTIGTDTIYISKGRIPDRFLRGCGVPDDLIGYIKSIAGAIQYYSCFISYSTKTGNLLTGCMPTCRRRACAAGLRHTTSGAGGRFMSSLTKPFACMTSYC